jgi:hypothetical protein
MKGVDFSPIVHRPTQLKANVSVEM